VVIIDLLSDNLDRVQCRLRGKSRQREHGDGVKAVPIGLHCMGRDCEGSDCLSSAENVKKLKKGEEWLKIQESQSRVTAMIIELVCFVFPSGLCVSSVGFFY